MIQIRAFYGAWKTVTKEQAREFITVLMDGMMCPKKQKIEIAQQHVKGIAVSELLEVPV